MSRKLISLLSFVLALGVALSPCLAVVGPVTGVTTDNPPGSPPFNLQSITVGSYTVDVSRLASGTSTTTLDPVGGDPLEILDDLEIGVQFSGGETGAAFTVHLFGGQNWANSNGDEPDFFLFEAGDGDGAVISAILPGGQLGQTITLPDNWGGDTGFDGTNGQNIVGISFAITDLLDAAGNPLTNNSVIEGLAITDRSGLDPADWCAVASAPILTAMSPTPADGALHEDTWVNLGWLPGDTAASHDIYVSDNFDDVNDRTAEAFRGNQPSVFLVVGFPGFAFPDGLVPGTTYYWAVDEVEADGTTKHKGPVWSFSIPPKTAYNPDPPDGAEFVDPSATFSWTGGFGAKLHTVYMGTNFDDVNNAAGGTPLGSASFSPAALEPEKVYYWRVDEFDPPFTHKGDIWSFTTPGAVGNPQPANGAADVQKIATLSWRPADNAASHELYFGTDADAVRNAAKASPEYIGPRALGAENYDPGGLAWESSYAWRVDEVYPTETVKGLVWSFTTADFILVDGFELYNDIDPPDAASNRIFDKWIDGFGTTTNGALVGNDLPPYAEQTVVHGGAQSMPYLYDNNLKTSEATLTLVYPRDWTEEGVTKLSLWFRGASGNSAERMFVALNGTAVVYHDDASPTQTSSWTEWIIDLSAFGGLGVDLTNVNSITIGLGTKNSPAAGGSGQMYFDDIRLLRPKQVGPTAAGLFAMITEADPYQSWAQFPEAQGAVPSNPPHGAMARIFINVKVQEAMQNFTGSLPDGAIIVKENLGENPTEKAQALTVMWKVAGFDPDNNDWFWANVTPDGQVNAEGKVPGCVNCHGAARANDFVFKHQF